MKDVLTFLEKKYCDTLALQVGGCPPEVRNWFFNEFEKKDLRSPKKMKFRLLRNWPRLKGLKKFLHFHFLGQKRFSLEGLDALIPMLDYLLRKGTAREMKSLVIGMAHRGRINVLINILKQSPKIIFAEFQKSFHSFFDEKTWTRDVKYHLGFSSKRQTPNGDCNLYLGYNPSHLEASASVIVGMTRAIQRNNADTKKQKNGCLCFNSWRCGFLRSRSCE